MDETDDWFTHTCSNPHLVVMIEASRCVNVPAKIISFDETNVFVRYFFELSAEDIPYDDKLKLYSKETRSMSKQPKSVVDAFKVSEFDLI